MKLTDVHIESRADQEPSAGLVSALTLLRKKLGMITAITGVIGCIAGLIVILIPSYYTSESTLVVPSPNRSLTSALVGQLGPMAALTGDMGNKDSSDRYISLLKSNTISDALIREHDLRNVYKKKRIQQLRDKLADHTRFQVLKGGLIMVSVTDVDPRRAADLANGYVEQLYKLNSRLAVDEATQRREFYQQQVDSAKQQLSSDEQRLKDSQEKTGLIQPDAQAKGIIETLADIRALLAEKEIEIKIMATSATESNPDLIRLRAQVAGLHSELKKLEGSDGATGLVGTRNLPSAGLEYARRMRDVKIDEAMVAILIKQFEEARMDEAKSAPLVQMVDRAQPPDEKAGPQRFAIILGSMLSGLVGSIVYVLWGRSRMQLSGTAKHVLSRVDEF